MNSHQLGIVLGCIENGVDPRTFNELVGMAKVASENPGIIGRTISSAAHDVMASCGRGHTAPAQHLLLLSKQASWCPQFQDTVDVVLSCMLALQPLEKKAFRVNTGDVTGGLSSVAKGVGYGSLLGGSALGALYWILSRHAQQDDSDLESMSHQAEYYKQLTGELEHNLRQKYNYNEQTPEPSTTKSKKRKSTATR